MTRTEFNMAIARRVMGWNTSEDEWRLYVFPATCFDSDHNAAALVRERVKELGKYRPFLNHLADCVNAHWPGDLEFSAIDAWAYLRATPEQTARAAYAAVTGEELEAVDE